jgi:large conductance mechanosensitive channel
MVLPIVSLLPFLNRNMDQKFAVLSKGPNFDQQNGYNTLLQAREDGALVLAYGCVDSYFSYSSSFGQF